MRKGIILAVAAIALLATSTLNARGAMHYRGASGVYKQSYVDPTVYELTQEQIDDLVFMYQEEKMARDAYITLGQKWGSTVFLKIQQSEQSHMDAIKALLDKYSIAIPVDESAIGSFANEEIQALYDQLMEKGALSLQDALEVGVAIEETDIADLEEKIEGATSDLATVYSRLLKGSYNHLNAFNTTLGI